MWEVQEKYFKEYLDKEYYDNPKHRREGTGILVFLYLRERFNFPKDRIIFISAYVGDETSGDKGTLEYNTLKQSMKNLGCKLGLARQKPSAFTATAFDPFGSLEETDPVFYEEFVLKNNTPYVKFRRCILEMSQLILSHFEALSLEAQDKFVRIRHKHCFNQTSGTVKTQGAQVFPVSYFVDLLHRIKLLPLLPDDESHSLSTLLGDLVYFCDSITEGKDSFYPRDNTVLQCREESKKNVRKCEYALEASPPKGELGKGCCYQEDCFFQMSGMDNAGVYTLKMLRNSLSHGAGCEKSDYLVCKEFVVALLFRMVFQLDSFSKEEKKKYDLLEKELLPVGKFSKEEIIKEVTEDHHKIFIESNSPAKNKDKTMKTVTKSIKEAGLTKDTTPFLLYKFFLSQLIITELRYEYQDKTGYFICKPEINTHYLEDLDFPEKNMIQYAYEALNTNIYKNTL